MNTQDINNVSFLPIKSRVFFMDNNKIHIGHVEKVCIEMDYTSITTVYKIEPIEVPWDNPKLRFLVDSSLVAPTRELLVARL